MLWNVEFRIIVDDCKEAKCPKTRVQIQNKEVVVIHKLSLKWTIAYILKILKDELSSSYQLSHPGFMHKQNDLYGPQIRIQKDLGPHVLLEPWSLTMKGRFIKSKLYVMSLIAIWWGWTPTLTLGSRRPKRGARWGSGASAVHFGRKFIKQKLLGTANFVG